MFINPDLTLYIEREPVDEWVALESETRIAAGGASGSPRACSGTRRARIGRAIQSLLVGPR